MAQTSVRFHQMAEFDQFSMGYTKGWHIAHFCEEPELAWVKG
jgi:hypothetical protein